MIRINLLLSVPPRACKRGCGTGAILGRAYSEVNGEVAQISNRTPNRPKIVILGLRLAGSGSLCKWNLRPRRGINTGRGRSRVKVCRASRLGKARLGAPSRPLVLRQRMRRAGHHRRRGYVMMREGGGDVPLALAAGQVPLLPQMIHASTRESERAKPVMTRLELRFYGLVGRSHHCMKWRCYIAETWSRHLTTRTRGEYKNQPMYIP